MKWAPEQTIFGGNGFAISHMPQSGPGLVHHCIPIFAFDTKIPSQFIEKTSEKKSFDKVNGMA
jgi:hypothetical protein